MKKMDLMIRAYRAADLEELSAIWFEASITAHAFVGEARLREQRLLIETVYLPNAETWVAIRDGEPAGFVSLLDDFIGGLFVSPRHQGAGIGRLLVSHALQLKGQLRLEVYTANSQAYAFYENLGFEEQSRRSEDDEGLPFENAQMLLKQR
ncbi:MULTISPECIES: GNAT family N-acetyltransferase [Ensifer]|uniref:GNAT family N-acetyltransferase n=1 Tax=Ensifer adhaerens TaxID=106592 RepID=A0ABY8HCC4_ENSAD|nr:MULTISPECIES: GNAT family N-acetyltransferase [Ensifer]ANK73669.1 acetyltransferase [Ensifer adhaerens]KDP70376.1 acetyltransferase [Ensifer adhaerens]KQX27099.1 acetyltransferase [Ensifer sp. Root423]KQZ58867.1 acetyltransferase [Ensifer sp. Root558]MDF8355707.1 GNAT family N-acetyltransferase [Ensifer adhaerens]